VSSAGLSVCRRTARSGGAGLRAPHSSRPRPGPILSAMQGDEHVFHMAAFEAGPGEPSPERAIEAGLRPTRLTEFVGQGRVVHDLRVHLEAAQQRGEPPDHILFSGPPGLGKTSLARILAAELGTRLHATTGPALERPKDLVGLLTNLQQGDVLFLDEIHRVPVTVEEYLYTAMEDFRIEMTVDSGLHARVLPITIKPFTLVGATTREGLLSRPFRERFGLFERLDPYPAHELAEIIQRQAQIFGLVVEPEAAALLAERARGTPRIAGRFLRRVRDYGQVAQAEVLDLALVETTLKRLGVDALGLEEMDRRVLRCLADQAGGPCALKTIAAVVGETEDTIEDVFEPHLLREGLLLKTARGRVLAPAGWRAIGRTAPAAAARAEGPAARGLYE
jgi:Holliday junction DNA helicase RuvB